MARYLPDRPCVSIKSLFKKRGKAQVPFPLSIRSLGFYCSASVMYDWAAGWWSWTKALKGKSFKALIVFSLGPESCIRPYSTSQPPVSVQASMKFKVWNRLVMVGENTFSINFLSYSSVDFPKLQQFLEHNRNVVTSRWMKGSLLFSWKSLGHLF